MHRKSLFDQTGLSNSQGRVIESWDLAEQIVAFSQSPPK